MYIEYTEKLDLKTLDLLDNEFKTYANKNSTNSNYRFCNFIAKSQSETVGVLKGHSNYDEVIVEDLIVIEKYRGIGVGTRLIKAVEEYCKDKAFKCISLCTYEFQAPEFYKKYGFELEYKRENKENPKLSKYFFVKYF